MVGDTVGIVSVGVAVGVDVGVAEDNGVISMDGMAGGVGIELHEERKMSANKKNTFRITRCLLAFVPARFYCTLTTITELNLSFLIHDKKAWAESSGRSVGQ